MLKRLLTAIALLLTVCAAFSCTIYRYTQHGEYFVASNFDWNDGRIVPVYTKAGGYRQAAGTLAKGKLARWPIRYASLTFDMANFKHPKQPNKTAVPGGINSQGLQVAVLWLGATQYPTKATKAIVPSAMLTNYLLDQAKNVKQAIALTSSVSIEATNYHGLQSKIQYMVNDAAGHTAILELLHGKLTVLQGKQLTHRLLTNTVYRTANADYAKAKQQGVYEKGYHSLARYERAAKLLDEHPPQTAKQAFAILHSVAEPKDAQMPTQWEVIYNLSKRTVMFSRDFRHYKIYRLKS